jgi:hypothetical protein
MALDRRRGGSIPLSERYWINLPYLAAVAGFDFARTHLSSQTVRFAMRSDRLREPTLPIRHFRTNVHACHSSNTGKNGKSAI